MASLTSRSAAETMVSALVDGRTLYLSCHTAKPGLDGDFEVKGFPYVRQPVSWKQDGARRVNREDVRFVLPDAVVSWIGIWDASTGGTFQSAGSTVPMATESRDTYLVPAGTVSIAVKLEG